MEPTQTNIKADEEHSRHVKRAQLKQLNDDRAGEGEVQLASIGALLLTRNRTVELAKALDSSLKRHTALIKKIKQSMGVDNHDQILKDIDTLSLEKYIDEIAGAVTEGIVRCKLEKDVWSAAEVCGPTSLAV